MNDNTCASEDLEISPDLLRKDKNKSKMYYSRLYFFNYVR